MLIASLGRAVNLADSTLNFGRAEEAPPRRELTPLRPLVEEVGDGLGLPRDGAINWTIDMDDALRVDVDRDQLFRVLNNLTRNALQAIEQQDGAGGHIKIAALRDGKRVTIEVSDDGPGVPERARAHLFQAFQGSARKGGTGLGLAVAQELLNAHGGSIRLRDTAKGATFELEIPDRGGIPGDCGTASSQADRRSRFAPAADATGMPRKLPDGTGRQSATSGHSAATSTIDWWLTTIKPYSPRPRSGLAA
jgi:signal transduction histidine kinase